MRLIAAILISISSVYSGFADAQVALLWDSLQTDQVLNVSSPTTIKFFFPQLKGKPPNQYWEQTEYDWDFKKDDKLKVLSVKEIAVYGFMGGGGKRKNIILEFKRCPNIPPNSLSTLGKGEAQDLINLIKGSRCKVQFSVPESQWNKMTFFKSDQMVRPSTNPQSQLKPPSIEDAHAAQKGDIAIDSPPSPPNDHHPAPSRDATQGVE